jgi:transposase
LYERAVHGAIFLPCAGRSRPAYRWHHRRRPQRARRYSRHFATPTPRQVIPLAAEMYKWRHLIENFFRKLKQLKRIAMRACKTDRNFETMIYLAAAVTNSR